MTLHPVASARLGGVEILVVDDNLDLLYLLQIFLESQGAVVSLASSAEEALALLQIATPHVMVSDLAMPGGDGCWLMRQAQELERAGGAAVPAIALTAHRDRSYLEAALGAGFRRYLTKPVDLDDLCHAIIELARPGLAGTRRRDAGRG
jgi:CheY-like chemotaxis protein